MECHAIPIRMILFYRRKNMNKALIPRQLLNLGILGVFLFAFIVAVGSFALFGCFCVGKNLRPESPSEPVETVPSTPSPSQGSNR